MIAAILSCFSIAAACTVAMELLATTPAINAVAIHAARNTFISLPFSGRAIPEIKNPSARLGRCVIRPRKRLVPTTGKGSPWRVLVLVVLGGQLPLAKPSGCHECKDSIERGGIVMIIAQAHHRKSMGKGDLTPLFIVFLMANTKKVPAHSPMENMRGQDG